MPTENITLGNIHTVGWRYKEGKDDLSDISWIELIILTMLRHSFSLQHTMCWEVINSSQKSCIHNTVIWIDVLFIQMLNRLPFLPLYLSFRWEGAPLSTLSLKQQISFSITVSPGPQGRFGAKLPPTWVGVWCQNKSPLF